MFERAITARCDDAVAMRSMTLPWPDEPMERGYAQAGMDGLKEYQGDADEIVRFVGVAEILVTHLAPVSVRLRQIRVVNTPGRNASAVAEFTIDAILAQTRLIGAGHDALRARSWRGDLYRADPTGRELSEMTVGIVGYGQIGTRVVRLLDLPNVTLTPYIAGAAVRTVTVTAEAAAEELRRFVAGEPPLNPC